MTTDKQTREALREAATAKAVGMLLTKSTAQLCECFSLTDKMTDNPGHEGSIATARGWMMDALEIRDPAAFSVWMEDCTGAEPAAFFLK